MRYQALMSQSNNPVYLNESMIQTVLADITL